MMIPRINTIPVLGALGLFFLPWIDISCQDKTIATQSGFEMMTGNFTAVPQTFPYRKDHLDSEGRVTGGVEGTFTVNKSRIQEQSDSSRSNSVLMVLSFICLVLSGFVCLSCWFLKNRILAVLAMTVPVFAIILMAVQVAIGFPAQHAVADYLDSQTTPQNPESIPSDDAQKAMAQFAQDTVFEQLKDIKLNICWPMYLEVGLLSMSLVLCFPFLIRTIPRKSLRNTDSAYGP